MCMQIYGRSRQYTETDDVIIFAKLITKDDVIMRENEKCRTTIAIGQEMFILKRIFPLCHISLTNK